MEGEVIKRDFEDAHKNHSGIYALKHGEKIVYIGKTSCFFMRYKQHLLSVYGTKPCASGVLVKKYMAENNCTLSMQLIVYSPPTKRIMQGLEGFLIDYYNPTCNSVKPLYELDAQLIAEILKSGHTIDVRTLNNYRIRNTICDALITCIKNNK